MSETAKKAVLIVVIVLALGFAVYSGSRLIGGEKMQVAVKRDLPPGTKSAKQLEMEAQQQHSQKETGDATEALAGQ